MPSIVLSDYQKRAARFAVEKRRTMLALACGLGKTAITLAAFTKLKRAGKATNMLIVAPLRPAYAVWPLEIPKWDQFKGLSFKVLHGKHKDRDVKQATDITIINYEGLPWLLDKFDKNPFDCIVFDESTILKSPSSKRFKAIQKWAFDARYVWLLTGTPRPRSVQDLWSQVYLLDGGRALGPNITTFRNRYMYPARMQGHVVYEYGVRAGAEDEIQKAIEPIVLSMRAEDYLTLPEMITTAIEVELPPAAAKAYKSMEKEMFAQLDAGDVVALSAASAYGKCRQIASGSMYGEEGVHVIHDEKHKALKELLDSVAEPVLVAIQYRHEIESVSRTIKEATGYTPPVIAGGSKTDIMWFEKEWNAGNIPVAVVNPASLSHGINLQRQGIGVVWFSLSESLELYDQLNHRLLRRGREKPVFVWHIVARNTVDTLIIKRNIDKSARQQSLLEALSDYRRTKNLP